MFAGLVVITLNILSLSQQNGQIFRRIFYSAPRLFFSDAQYKNCRVPGPFSFFISFFMFFFMMKVKAFPRLNIYTVYSMVRYCR